MIMWLMTLQKNLEIIAILKIWVLLRYPFLFGNSISGRIHQPIPKLKVRTQNVHEFVLLFFLSESIWLVQEFMKIQDSYFRNWLVDPVSKILQTIVAKKIQVYCLIFRMYSFYFTYGRHCCNKAWNNHA